MKLHTMGMNFRHDSKFLIDRPDGSGDELLLVFKTPAVIRLDDMVQSVSANSAIIFSKSFHQYYGADGGDYINHWVHFDCEDDSGYFRRIGLPFNTVIPVADMTTAENMLDMLSVESVSSGSNRGENINLMLRLLLSKLAEGVEKNGGSSPHSAELRVLRAELHRNPANKRCIGELAASLSLSASHFQYLYKTEFGISCHEDILNARIDMAKYYLRSTALSVKEIAELCGYENDVHFIRQFKKRMGMTSGEYRKIL